MPDRRPARLFAAALALLLAGAGHGAHAQAAPPAAADPRLVWDLGRLFPTDAAWDAERQAFADTVPALAALRGTLGRDPASLRSALDRISAAEQRLRRLWTYAGTQISTDNGNRRNQERMALVGSLYGRYSSSVAWVDPELQALGAARLADFQAAEPGLKPHATRIRQALRRAPHTLAPDVEAALAAFNPVLGSASGTRELLVNADIAWPVLQVDGKPVTVDDNGYDALRRHPDRAVRKQAFEAFWGAYGRFENTLGALLAQRVQQGVIDARLRQHPSAAAASLAETEVPEAVLRTLVAEVNKALPTLHRYFRLRQTMLKLPDMAYHDIYPDLVASSTTYPPQEAAAITAAAVRPLGDDYQAELQLALQARTMHVRPAPGKRSGAYAASVYGQTPFIFLNHTDNYESLVTFAHEWGHGMHSVLAQRAQPKETADYPLFLAEIASTTNEALLTAHMLKTARSKDERLFVLTQELERLRATFFRQTMFAEFELATHDAQQRGEALSGKTFTEMYCSLLRRYHGADAGVVAINPAYCAEWAYIPHFHRPFYVYAYATSITAAQFFAQRMLAGEPGAREAYLGVLQAGGSVPPHALLQRAGLDLTSAAPYQVLVRRMEQALDEVEALLR